jgi:hypothetical protein
MSYGPEVSDLFRSAVVYVDKILKGARSADLPVEQPAGFKLAINLKTAKALVITIPHTITMLGSCMRSGFFLATMLVWSSLAAAETPLTIDQLLAQGWEIAGYASGYDNRTSLILFRHPGANKLVQCGILYDVTRTPRTVVNCYELR